MECHFFLTFKLDPRWESRRNKSDTLWRCCCCLVTKSCLTLCKPMDCNPSGSCVHGILQVRILERVAISFSGDLPNQGIEPESPALQTDSSSLSHGGTYSLKMVSFNSEHVIYLKKPQRFLLIKREPFNQIDSLVITVPLWGGWGDVQVQSDLPGCCLNYTFILSPDENRDVRFRNRKKKRYNFLFLFGAEYGSRKIYMYRSSILAWTILWTEEPGALQFLGSQKSQSQTTELLSTHIHHLQEWLLISGSRI